MKRWLAALSALIMLLTCACAEVASPQAVPLDDPREMVLPHLLEMTNRLDTLLRSERFIEDSLTSNYANTEDVLTEEETALARLRAGNRERPRAVYAISGETMRSIFAPNVDVMNSKEMVNALSELPLQLVRDHYLERMTVGRTSYTTETVMSELIAVLSRQKAFRVTAENECGMLIALYEEALPIVTTWYVWDGIANVAAFFVPEDKLAACQTAEEVSVGLTEAGLPEMACELVDMTGVEAAEFVDPFKKEGSQPLPAETLVRLADGLDSMVTGDYMTAVLGVSAEDVARIGHYPHGEQKPRYILRLDMSNVSELRMAQLMYAREEPVVRMERLSTLYSELLVSMLSDVLSEQIRDMHAAYDQDLEAWKAKYNPPEEEKAEDGTDEQPEEDEGEKQDDRPLYIDEAEEERPSYLDYYHETTEVFQLGSMVYSSAMVDDPCETQAALYLLVYDTGMPIFILYQPDVEAGSVICEYLPSAALQKCQTALDGRLWVALLSKGLTAEEIPQE